jgi:hypothetical protein
MATPVPSQIESEFARLSPEAQLDLLERLVRRVRVAVSGRAENWDAELSAMAADPQVQQELHSINSEFRGAEADGLESN